MFFCGSFTTPVKTDIRERANWVSELTGENDRPLVCAHFKHRRGRENAQPFNHQGNGILVTDIEHLAHHQLFKFKNFSKHIHLSTEQNYPAICALIYNCKSYNEEKGISYGFTQIQYEFAVKAWVDLIHDNHRILGLPKDKNLEVVSELIKNIIVPDDDYSSFEEIMVKPWDEPPIQQE